MRCLINNGTVTEQFTDEYTIATNDRVWNE